MSQKPFSNEKVIERIYSRVNVVGECWEWNGERTCRGYGRMYWRKKMWFVHRLVYSLKNGEIPAGMIVCHKCDNPSCCNPDHLWVGTHKENAHDSMSKGRRKKQGDSCPHGHKYGENPLINKHYGTKMCRVCANLRCRKWHAENREYVSAYKKKKRELDGPSARAPKPPVPPVPPEVRSCEGCGSEFSTNNQSKKFCTERCRINCWKRKDRDLKKAPCPTSNCEHCGKPYSVTRKDKRFCKKTCNSSFTSKRKRALFKQARKERA